MGTFFLEDLQICDDEVRPRREPILLRLDQRPIEPELSPLRQNGPDDLEERRSVEN